MKATVKPKGWTVKPKGWTVLGTGPLADSIRTELARDPDRYRPETWSIEPAGHCPCCDEDVFRCTTRHTGWEPGYATHSNRVHPAIDPVTCLADPKGAAAGCCCVPPNYGRAHATKRRARKARKAKQ